MQEIIKLVFLTNEDYEFSSGFMQKYSDEIYDFITSASYKDYDEENIKSFVRIINQLITYKGKTVLESKKEEISRLLKEEVEIKSGIRKLELLFDDQNSGSSNNKNNDK